jgi:hypothetical protein
VSTENSRSTRTRATLPKPSPDLSASAPADLAPATIGSLVSDLAMIIGALEKHVGDMNYPDTDDFNALTIRNHPFDSGTYQILYELAKRVQQLGNDLYSVEEERQSYAALPAEQQSSRTQELEQETEEAQTEQRTRAEWLLGAADRETAWAAMPPESTAPGRYHESVKKCAKCGARVETINGIRRCWVCFRRRQNGR